MIPIFKSNNTFSDTLWRAVSIDELFELISDSNSEPSLQHELYKLDFCKKEELHSIFFSIGFDKYKELSLCKADEYINYLCFDFDKLDNETFGYTWQTIEDDEYTRLMFRSPSGNGIKVVVECTSDFNTHKDYYNTLIKYYKELTGLDADAACKNINRACFMPHDPNAIYNEDSSVYKLKVKKEDKPTSTSTANEKGLDSERASEALRLCVKFVKDDKLDFIEGQRNNFIHRLACKTNRYGVKKSDLIDYVNKNYSKDNEYLITINSAYKNNLSEFASIAFKPSKSLISQEIVKENKKTQLFTDHEINTYNLHPFLHRYNITGDTDKCTFISLIKHTLDHIKLGIRKHHYIKVCDELEINNEELVSNFYDFHQFIYDTCFDAGRDGNVKLAYKVNAQTICDRFTEQHLQCRKNTTRHVIQYFDFYQKKFDILDDIETKNTIEKIMLDYYNLKSVNAIKSMKLTSIEKYCEVTEYFESIEKKYYSPSYTGMSPEDSYYYFLDLFKDRFHESMDRDLIRSAVKVWGVFVPAQYFGVRKNEIALGAVSQKQGSGKTMFMEMLTKPFIRMDLRGRPTFDNTSPDGIRDQTSNVILHDDELGVRTKKDIKLFKESLSAMYFKFTEKYKSQLNTVQRTVSHTYCANTVNFLKEDSRRDFIIKFAENNNKGISFGEISSKCDDELMDRVWAYFYHEFKNNFTVVQEMYHVLVEEFSESNKEMKELSPARDGIGNLFKTPSVDLGKLEIIEFNPLKRSGEQSIFDYYKEFVRMSFVDNKYIVIRAAEIQSIIEESVGTKVFFRDVESALKDEGYEYKNYRIANEKKTKRGFLIYPKYRFTPEEEIEQHESTTIDSNSNNSKPETFVDKNGQKITKFKEGQYQTEDPDSDDHMPF